MAEVRTLHPSRGEHPWILLVRGLRRLVENRAASTGTSPLQAIADIDMALALIRQVEAEKPEK